MINMNNSKSQIQQDIILDEQLFNKKENGVFVEVGALDGFGASNTWFFEKERNWSGLLIEPNPVEFNIRKIDFISIDVEGAELQVLNSINFDKVDISVFMIENNYGLERETKFLLEKGYGLLGNIQWDSIFIKKDLRIQ